jgi:NAD(P)-dependent dehydrogenase (short-subunit alcohol dehydrogenase family)
VNNAGIFHVTPVWAEEPAPIRRTVAVNYAGAMRMAQKAFAAMADTGGGSIVNVASVVEMGMYGASTYGTTKGAVSAGTRSMAVAGRRYGVRVNAVSPRGSTRMIIANGREFDEANPAVPPELTGPIVTYLLSDLAADVTGQVIRLQVDILAVLGDPTPTGRRHPVEYTPSGVDDAVRRLVAEDRQPYGWNDPVARR